MSKNKYPQLVVSSNEDVAAASFLYLLGDNIVESYKQAVVTKIDFGSIIPSIKNNLFHQGMFNFVNKID